MTGLSAEQLRERYGKPQTADLSFVLRLLDHNDPVDPHWSMAYRYPSVEAFEAFADGNRRHHGHESLGPAVTEDGVFGVTLLRL
jgi:hypothetical protein